MVLGGGRSVDRAEDEVAGFGRPQRRLERLPVAHFAHQDDVGVFADGVLHADLEVLHVLADLPLVDQALVLGEGELDRVFEREDVLAIVVVDPVEHRGDGRALARAGHAGQEDHPLAELAKLFQDGRQDAGT